MKRSVSKRTKFALAVGTLVLIVAEMAHTKEAGYLALMCAVLVTWAVYDCAPRWLRYSSLGRWLRR